MIRLLMLLTALAVSPRILGLGVEPEASAPDALEPWIPWVLAEDDQRDCPLIGIKGERSCAWPGRLELGLDRTGAVRAALAPLRPQLGPTAGAPDQWPEEVRVRRYPGGGGRTPGGAGGSAG